MTITNPEPTLTVTFNKAELEYIRGLTQNDELTDHRNEYNIRLELFVAVSKALGFDMNADGSVNRCPKGIQNG